MIETNINWIGEIPKDWELKKLKNCGSFKTGKDYKELQVGSIPVYGSSEIPFEYVNKALCNKKSIAVGRKGTIDQPFITPNKFWAVDTCLYNTVDNKNWNFQYVFYWMKIIPFKEIGTKTAVPSLTQTQVNNLPIAYPKLEQQEKIANYLDKETSEIDRKISILEQKFEKLEEYKQSMIFETVTKGLNASAPMKDSGIAWIGEIPIHWDILRLKDASIIKKGETFNEKLASEDGCYPYINGGIKPSDWSNYFNSNENTIAVSEGGASAGYTQFMKTKYWAGSHCYKIQSKNKKTDNKYIYYVLKGFEKYLMIEKTGSAMPNLQKTKFINFLVSFVNDVKEQKQIVNYLDMEVSKIDKKKEIIRKKIELLKEYKQTIIYEAVTGKIDIN